MQVMKYLEENTKRFSKHLVAFDPDDKVNCWVWLGPCFTGKRTRRGRTQAQPARKPYFYARMDDGLVQKCYAVRFAWILAFNVPPPEHLWLIRSIQYCNSDDCVNPHHRQASSKEGWYEDSKKAYLEKGAAAAKASLQDKKPEDKLDPLLAEIEANKSGKVH